MKRLFAALLLPIFVPCVVAQPPPNLLVLVKGTEIKLRMSETLTSKHAYLNQRVELEVADDVVIDGALLVPKHTRVLGTVTEGKKEEGKKNNPHNVAIQIDYIRLGNRHIALTGDYSAKGKVGAGSVITGAALLGLTGVLIAMDNRTGELKEGTEVKAVVAEDVALPPLSSQSKP
jgi:hypothetical protein